MIHADQYSTFFDDWLFDVPADSRIYRFMNTGCCYDLLLVIYESGDPAWVIPGVGP